MYPTIPASMIPAGGPWGPAAPAVIDGTALVVLLAALAVGAAVIAASALLSRSAHPKMHRVNTSRLRTHSA